MGKFLLIGAGVTVAAGIVVGVIFRDQISAVVELCKEEIESVAAKKTCGCCEGCD